MKPGPTTVIRVPRPTWQPTTDEQRAALAAIDQAVTEARQMETAAAEKVRQAIERARGIGVPMREVVKRVGAGRATVYRRLSRGQE